jgi:hypothetical protein
VKFLFPADDGISQDAAVAISLVKAAFGQVRDVKTMVSQDPESDAEWLLIRGHRGGQAC